MSNLHSVTFTPEQLKYVLDLVTNTSVVMTAKFNDVECSINNIRELGKLKNDTLNALLNAK